MPWSEQEEITYSTLRLEHRVAALKAEGDRQSVELDEAKVRLLEECSYQSKTRSNSCRVVIKAKVLAKGTDIRFVVTTRIDPDPSTVYDWYVDRGEPKTGSRT